MMKKFLAALLAVVMTMSLSFVTALASEEEIPATDPYAHTEHTDWSWTSTNSLPDSSGYYYLSSDVTLSDSWSVLSGETVLCLNGHDINLNGSNNISVRNGAKLTICDCSQDSTNGYIDENEQIWKPGTNDGSESLALTGGVIYGASENRAISVNSGTLTLSGGNIAGNNGSGIRVNSGAFYMYGGSVCGNRAVGSSEYDLGGGLYLNNGSKATMFGGKISNNTADSGGGVAVAVDSSFTLKGGYVSYNTALDDITGYTRGGGGFFVLNSGSLTVEGGYIEYNQASIGSGIMTQGMAYGSMTYVNLYGGSIQYNRSTSNDGAVYISGSSFVTKLSIKGNPVVDNNMSGNGEVNVDFYSTTLIKFYIEGTLTAGANIGFSSHNAQPNNYVFTDGWSEYEHEVDLSIFTEDTKRFDEIVQKNNELILHRHSLYKDRNYSQEGSIRIYCSNCGREAILSTDMLDSYIYDGQPKSANLVADDGWNEMIELGLVDGTAEFTYLDITNYDPYAPDFDPEDPAQLPIELDSAPADVGKYWVSVSLPSDYREFSFEHTFTIEPATPKLSISAVPDKLSGGGKIELTVSGAPDGSAISVSCSDSGAVITEENGKFYAELPNSTKDYIFTATSTATDNFTSGAAECTVEVTNKSDPIIINPPKPIEPGDDDGNNSDDEPEDVVPPMLNGDDHFAYVIGYEDGTVKPDGQITRAEVATIIFRLLDPEVRDENLTTENSFTDVNEGDWYNTAISTLVELGIIEGRSDTIFDPNAPITRAEFATLFARFDESGVKPDGGFTDVTTHWARESIERAAALGWINGYEDGTFRPDNKITRAEAMTMINRVLNRDPEDESDLLPDMRVWSDNQPGTWYYFAVQEATNSHEYTRPDAHEDWTEITADPNWERYQ